MAADQKPTKVTKYLEFFTGGMNSVLLPVNVPESSYHWGENILNRGGIPQTRPGLSLKMSIPGIKLQGFTNFTPTKGIPYLVFAVDGLVYVSSYPFSTYRQLQGINFLPNAEVVTFTDCVKSVQRNNDGSLRIVSPRRVLVIQDGLSRSAYWDGIVAKQINPEPPGFGAPNGLWGAWVASRYWLLRGTQVIVSDYGDPLSFSENIYLAERSNFQLPGLGTGIIEVPNNKGVLVFTEKSTTAFKSYIRDRSLWQSTPDFQDNIIPDVGCVAGRSPVNKYGLTWWFSRDGLVNLNTALFTQQSSKLIVGDAEMMRSSRNMSPTLSGICTASYGNILLVSVPSGSLYNSHTWVMDEAVLQGQSQNSPPAWAGVWSGFRPVEWANLEVLGRERLFFAAYDQDSFEDTKIHIWEAFQDERLDRGNRISCQFETKEVLPTSKFAQFNYAEIDLVEIIGDVSLKVFYAGIKGGYELILDTVLQAEVGSIGGILQEIITTSSILQGYKPQSRTLKTKEVTGQDGSNNANCGIEGDKTANIDKAFSLLFEWKGRMAIRGVTLTFTTFPESDKGDCEESEQGEHNIVTERGVGIPYPPVTA